MRRLFLLLALFTICAALTQAQAEQPTALSPPHSGSLPPLTISKLRDIRVVYDVKDDVWEAGIGKALYYVRGLLEAYKAQGVNEKALKISVVLHGPTVYWLLNETAYRRFKKDEFDFNPNEQVVEELIQHGVSVEACDVTLKGKGWTGDDLLPGVIRVHDGYTRLIDLQQNGYAYIRF